MSDRCRHNLRPEHCAHCDPEYARHMLRRRTERVVARHPGWCEICEEPVEPGTELRAVPGDGHAHADCVDWAEQEAETAASRHGDEP